MSPSQFGRGRYSQCLFKMRPPIRLFPSVDSNGDGFLDSDEVFSNINSNKMFKKPLTYSNLNTRMMGMEKRLEWHKSDDQHLDHCRQLCVDALVEEGDLNSDWRLNVQEFSRLFDSAYLPSDKSNLYQSNYVPLDKRERCLY